MDSPIRRIAISTGGGDGSLLIANALHRKGVRVVSVPKTIDNDPLGTLVSRS